MSHTELIAVGNKLYPAAITNYSLSMGEKLGIINNSHLTDLINSGNEKGIIYLSVIGLNKNLNITLDEFVETYDPSNDELIKNHKNLILSCTNIKQNNFAKGLVESISKKVDKDQKKIKSPKLNIECVEDRYVLYCLVYGIDYDIFWFHPIPDVERIYESKQAYDSWKNNPKTY